MAMAPCASEVNKRKGKQRKDYLKEIATSLVAKGFGQVFFIFWIMMEIAESVGLYLSTWTYP